MNIAAGYSYWGAILAQLWNNLEESIRTGQPPVNLYEWIEQQPDVSRDFQTWMIAIARLTSDEIVRKIKLPPDARRLLDVGGGHGMYSIALCQRHPALTATVFDSPQVLRVARTSIAAAHLDERIAVQPGNFWQDDLGSGYDIAFVFNIVHGFTPEQNTALLGNVARALHPGGTVVIQEQLAGRAPGPTAKAASQLLGLSYFHLLGGQIYRFADVARWLADAGFNAPRRINLLKSPGLSLIVATKAG
jgi:cyclopropane fatty-acyl-phospholipid synthase-like methyltransferase